MSFKRLTKQIWFSMRHYPRFLYCLWRVLRMPDPKISVFGGKYASRETEFYNIAFKCGKLLAEKNYSVLTGGGPGIMEAVLCGVLETRKPKNRALGVGVFGVDLGFVSECGYDVISLPDFDSRKWLLIRFSKGFIILPGGLGTLDELTDVINLIKTDKIEKVPIIMVGKEFWKPVNLWIRQGINQGLIPKKFESIIEYTDDVNQAVDYIEKFLQGNKKSSTIS